MKTFTVKEFSSLPLDADYLESIRKAFMENAEPDGLPDFPIEQRAEWFLWRLIAWFRFL